MYMDIQTTRLRVGANTLNSLRIADSRFAFQLLGGLEYLLSDRLTLGAQYKYLTVLGNEEVFGETNNSITADVGGNSSFSSNIGVHSMGLFAQVNF